jgi:hypothetical protein
LITRTSITLRHINAFTDETIQPTCAVLVTGATDRIFWIVSSVNALMWRKVMEVRVIKRA